MFYNCLTDSKFGVSAAPAVFQRCMKSLLQGCTGLGVSIWITYYSHWLHHGGPFSQFRQSLEHHCKAGLQLKLNKVKCEFL